MSFNLPSDGTDRTSTIWDGDLSGSSRTPQVHESLSLSATWRSPFLLAPRPVADARAQPQDQVGSRKHKPADHHAAAQATTLAPSVVGKNTIPAPPARSQSSVSEERGKHRTRLDAESLACPLPPGRPEAWAPSEGRCWPVIQVSVRLRPLTPFGLCSFTSITLILPQTPRQR